MAEMYEWDKSFREDKSKNPSFSSTLLDEIYRSIDGGADKFGEFKLQRQKAAKKPSGGGGRSKTSSTAVEDEEIASFRRAVLVEKWMETKVNHKVSTGRRCPPPSSLPEFDRKVALDNDPLFFSSGSSSSDSSFGWYSEAEAAMKPKPSCFGPFNRPKQVKTSVTSRSDSKKQNEFYLFDDDQTNKPDHSGLIRSKTRALKIYTSLKKAKQPISPGGRLTTFLNALFTNGHAKKSKDSGFEEERNQNRTERKSKSTNVSTCSSASSFSRSCLSKNSPRSREQLNNNNGMRRTVRFYPVSVIVDQDSRPCGEKTICDEQDFRKLPPTFPCSRIEKPKFDEFPAKYEDKKHAFNDEYDDEDDDMASDSSSDLFELDHLTIFKKEQYFEELPVYETTHLGTNRAIASGLIC